MKKYFLLLLIISSFTAGYSQNLMNRIEDSDVSELIGQVGVVLFNDGTQETGSVLSVYLIKGNLVDGSLKLQDGSKLKFKSKEIKSFRVAVKTPTVFSLSDSLGNSIRKVYTTQYVFEHPFATKDKVKPQVMQVLNPGYDSRIKIFPDPDAGVSRSIKIKGVSVSDSTPGSLILVKDSKVIYVDREHYARDFEKIFGDCIQLMNMTRNTGISFEAIAAHVLMYDQYCQQE